MIITPHLAWKIINDMAVSRLLRSARIMLCAERRSHPRALRTVQMKNVIVCSDRIGDVDRTDIVMSTVTKVGKECFCVECRPTCDVGPSQKGIKVCMDKWLCDDLKTDRLCYSLYNDQLCWLQLVFSSQKDYSSEVRSWQRVSVAATTLRKSGFSWFACRLLGSNKIVLRDWSDAIVKASYFTRKCGADADRIVLNAQWVLRPCISSGRRCVNEMVMKLCHTVLRTQCLLVVCFVGPQYVIAVIRPK